MPLQCDNPSKTINTRIDGQGAQIYFDPVRPEEPIRYRMQDHFEGGWGEWVQTPYETNDADGKKSEAIKLVRENLK